VISSSTAERAGVVVAALVWLASPATAWAQDLFEDETEESGNEPADGDEHDGEPEPREDDHAPDDGVATPPSERGGEQTDDRGGSGQGDRAAAESLTRVGEGLIELGRYDEACAKLEQSVEAYPLGDALLLLGECYERLGKLASSWAAYRQAAARYRAMRDAKREVALTRADTLEPKVPKLTLLAKQRVSGMIVVRDDTEFGVGVIGVPLAVDPGRHRLLVRADGYEPWTLELDLQPSERRTIEIPSLVRRTEPTRSVPTTSVRSGRGALFYAGVIVAGAGAASLASGALLAASASRDVSTAESSNDLCGASRSCTPAGRDLVARADRKAIAATTTLAVGAAAVVTGFVLVVVDPGGAQQEVGLTVSPLAGPGVGGITLGGSF